MGAPSQIVPLPGRDGKLSIRNCAEQPHFWLRHEAASSPDIQPTPWVKSSDFQAIRAENVGAVRRHQARLEAMGFTLVEESVTGQCGAGKVEGQNVLRLKYNPDFKVPRLIARLSDGTELPVEMVLVRHGSTDGGPTTAAKFEARIQQIEESKMSRPEKDERIAYIRQVQAQYGAVGYHEHAEDDRVFQGNVDAVTNNSDVDARKAAELVRTRVGSELVAKGWTPDMVVSSPLGRAMQVIAPTVGSLSPDTPAFTDSQLVEISFGAFDGRRVEAFGTNHPEDNRPSHPVRLFNLEDVSAMGVPLEGASHPMVDANGHPKKGESMVDCLLRADDVLSPDYLGKWVSENLSDTQISACKAKGKVNILAAGHSMIFASMMMRMGCAYTLSATKGPQGSNGSIEDPIGFDGKSKDGRALRLEHATPTLITPTTADADRQEIGQPKRPVGIQA